VKKSCCGSDTIIRHAVDLFAEGGPDGVSMRDIARACELNVGSLYHHFADKETLYLAAMQHAFTGKTRPLLELLESERPPRHKLLDLVDLLCDQLADDATFRKLLQREILDGDQKRLEILARTVFAPVTEKLLEVCKQAAPAVDSFLLIGSLFGMCLQHFQFTPLRRHLPGYRKEHEQAAVISTHVRQLVACLLDTNDRRTNPK